MRLRSSCLASLVGLVGLVVGCSSSSDDGGTSDDNITSADANAVLEIHPLDIWAQPIPDKELKLTVARDGHALKTTPGVTNILLKNQGTYAVHAEAPNHLALDLTVTFDGSGGPGGATVNADKAKGHGVAFGHTTRTIDGRSLTTHALYLGLRHKWFSAEGRPARRGNAVKLMMDGEEAWSTVRSDLVKAQKDVMASTWWWESDFELVRTTDIGGMSSDDRWKNTILGTLEVLPATKRVLVGEFLGNSSLTNLINDLTTDSKLRAYAEKPDDNFEMMQQGNDTSGKFRFEVPTFTFGGRVKKVDDKAPAFEVDASVASTVPAHDVDLSQMPFHLDLLDLASIHQKFMVVDDEVAYVGGMNLRHVDWDSSQHLPYDWRREKFGASDSARTEVKNKTKKPDTSPRKDYMVRVDGPSAQDVADVFHERWEFLRNKKVRYSENSSSFDVVRDIAPRENGIQLQVTATMPKPFWEHATAETWFNAVNNAEKYIYIEDQYFRVPMLNDAIAARMDQKPDLQLVVVTIGTGTRAPECIQTTKANAFFKERFPDRYGVYNFKSFDADKKEFADIDTHAKMLIVDDAFMSVGSTNKNNRGLIYEAELNVAIADPVVAELRQRIAQNFLGTDADLGDPAAWLAAIKDTAARNDAAFAAKGQGAAPQGLIYHLEFHPPSDCMLASVGPDET
jgi:hypothetical protein